MKRITALIIACAALVSCSQPADGGRESENTNPVTRTRAVIDSMEWQAKTTEWIDFGVKAEIHTIRSAGELAKVVKKGAEIPEIDFSRQTIVIAGGTLNHGYNGIGAQLEIGPDDGILTVEILPNIAAVMQPWRVVVYTAPIAKGIDIALDLKFVAPGDSISLKRHIPEPLIRP